MVGVNVELSTPGIMTGVPVAIGLGGKMTGWTVLFLDLDERVEIGAIEGADGG